MKVLGEGRFARFVEHEGFEFAERKGCTGIVSIVAITREQELVFVEQYRPPVQCRTIELVAGLAGDGEEESLETAARRELLEETGYAAGALSLLMEGPSAGGITSARVHYFLARDVSRVEDGGGVDDEEITVHVVPLASAYMWLQHQAAGPCLVDPKVFLGLTVALHGWNGAAVPAP